TTAASSCVFRVKATETTFPVALTAVVSYPTPEKVREDADGPTLIKNVPSAVVVTVLLVPVSVTDANGTGFPWASLTVPEIVRVCANANIPLNISTVNSDKNLFIVG